MKNDYKYISMMFMAIFLAVSYTMVCVYVLVNMKANSCIVSESLFKASYALLMGGPVAMLYSRMRYKEVGGGLSVWGAYCATWQLVAVISRAQLPIPLHYVYMLYVLASLVVVIISIFILFSRNKTHAAYKLNRLGSVVAAMSSALVLFDYMNCELVI